MKHLIPAIALVTVAACSGGSDSADTTVAPETTQRSTTTTSTTTTEPAETTTTSEVPVDDSIRQPLTGEIVESEDDKVSLPALVVKIDNNDASARRNHSGLAVADIVFEEIVEGDTRFAAVFHSQGSDPVGPIRSGRQQDVDILTPFNRPLFAWSGGNAGVTRLIRDSFLTDLNHQRNTGAYYRGPGSAPNDLYSSTDRLYELTPEDHPGPPPPQFAYVWPDEEFEGRDVVDVDLNLDGKRIGWTWDAEAGGFARFQSGSRHTDVVHGDIFATNVIVMVVDYKPSAIDARSPDAQTLGSGPLFVFSNGRVQVGRWQRDLAVSQIRLFDADGNHIALTPGNTWIEIADNKGDAAFIVPPDTEVDFSTIPLLDLDVPDAFPTDITIEFG